MWLEYHLFLDTASQIDSSALNGPLRFRVGEWTGLRGLGEKLIGLREGDERLIHLSPPEGFGHWDPEGVLHLPEDRLEGDLPPRDGAAEEVRTRAGFAACGRLYRLGRGRVALDLNHPFAGEPLTLFVQVRRVLPPSRPAAPAGGGHPPPSAGRRPADMR